MTARTGVGRCERLTVILTLAIAAVLVLGAGAAFLVGRQQAEEAAPHSEDSLVRTAPGLVDDPRAAEVVALFQHHFDAINKRDHHAWLRTVDDEDAAGWPEAQWRTEYSTTRDLDITLVALLTDPFRARVTFTSHQDPAFAPADLAVDCIDWGVTYHLVGNPGELLVGPPESGTVTRAAC